MQSGPLKIYLLWHRPTIGDNQLIPEITIISAAFSFASLPHNFRATPLFQLTFSITELQILK